ncbi:MAG: membrane protein insertion efficiency factor YidD [Desulfobulbus propionicus]|nr:MAG: membrane protein insertion efficiency factor YidD [Desulfobulbus propionicus]
MTSKEFAVSSVQGAKKICFVLIRGYQLCISPLFPPTCRFSPTCSQYAMEAIEKYGVFRGTGKAVLRILRCHPFSKGGYDPVN